MQYCNYKHVYAYDLSIFTQVVFEVYVCGPYYIDLSTVIPFLKSLHIDLILWLMVLVFTCLNKIKTVNILKIPLKQYSQHFGSYEKDEMCT